MSLSLGLNHEEVCLGGGPCFAVLPRKQNISCSFPNLHFLTGLKQLKYAFCRNSSPQLSFETVKTKVCLNGW